MNDLIYRRDAVSRMSDLLMIELEGKRLLTWNEVNDAINDLPSAEAMLYGYPVEHLVLIATVLRKENLPPERIAELLMDIGRIVAMVRDEYEDTLRKAVDK